MEEVHVVLPTSPNCFFLVQGVGGLHERTDDVLVINGE